MNKIKQDTLSFMGENGAVFYADTCLPLVDATERGKVEFKALARHHYPGERLTQDTEGLNTIGYWSANEPQDWGLDWHRNEGLEFHFLESGIMPYSIEKHEMELLPGDFTITRPWQQHKVGNPEVGIGKFFWIIIDVGVRRPHQPWVWPDWVVLSDVDLQRLNMLLRHNEQPVWKATNEIKACFKHINHTLHQDVNGSSSSRLRLHINELLILLLDMFDRGKMELNEALTNSMRSAKQFLSELSNNLAHPWTIEEMAASSGLGVTRFTHHCKQLTNLTPMQLLTQKRLKWAKSLLIENKEMSATQVAFTCGFATSQYFSTVFKKHENCSPQDYRMKIVAQSTYN
ncbi:AraC family transcriptional regulator [Reichenbachiella agarivorans]|uniref:AraC family transcriptional regulator n=1 Tax=Reichenbachiella agarivorans TaxID=2979464 RepID=A0ABY6CQF9_9BACT|nr:AraC family transcriptional regulator [Reichenbachiella agarivorans]UXP32756.1 AraC family transcriptional regulator [Reichenbachiella agarivorans]